MDLAPFSKTEYIIIPQVNIVKIIYHRREPSFNYRIQQKLPVENSVSFRYTMATEHERNG